MAEHSCLFCSVIEKKMNARIIRESDSTIVFKDINPQAPFHVLIVPKMHIENVNSINGENAHYFTDLMLTAKDLAHELGLSESGYRLVLNNGSQAGQSVFHVHMHMLAKRPFSWPPG
jgi:histidine triad (HIT) family protein